MIYGVKILSIRQLGFHVDLPVENQFQNKQISHRLNSFNVCRQNKK